MGGRPEWIDRIVAVWERAHGGDREYARAAFVELWNEPGLHADPVNSCTLAYFMADVQDDTAAASGVTRVTLCHVTSTRGV
jgi:hypothetical protein